jgi:hypothetical protein
MVTGRIPGPFGASDASERVLNLRRPLGFGGTAALPMNSEIVATLSVASTVRLAKRLKVASPPRKTATRILGASGTNTSESSREEFKAEVKQAQIQYLITEKGRQFFEDIPDAELDTIEGEHRMRKIAAQSCRKLLAAARAALSEDKGGKDGKALLTTNISVLSAYRNFAQDTRAWNRAFDKHYEKTKVLRAGLAGGPHGDAAVAHLMNVLKGKKAPPGYSNHSNGMAVDFGTSFERQDYTTNTDSDHRAGWRRTWFHRWLVSNARSFGFHPLATEEWHWDFR